MESVKDWGETAPPRVRSVRFMWSAEGAQIVNALQSIVARNVDSLESAVVSICMFQAGNTDNVTPRKLGPYCTPIHN